MDISKYVQDYNFNDYIEGFKAEFKERAIIEKYLDSNSEENFTKFSNEFWSNPNVSIESLKEKYNINKQIAYGDIIKAYPVDDYIHLLKMYYDGYSVADLVKEFAIPYNKVENIIIPVFVETEKTYCPGCFKNLFEIEKQDGDNSDTTYIFKCEHCGKIANYSDLLTCEEAEQEIQKLVDEKEKFNDTITMYKKALEDEHIKCPKCQEKLYLNSFPESFSYQIKCTKCKYSSGDIDKTIEEYQAWKQRAAMMIAIRAKEKELIEKSLETKRLRDIIFKKEDIIRKEDNNNTLVFLSNTSAMDDIQLWSELFTRIRLCNRLEKKVLKEIIELTKSEGTKKVIPLGYDVSVYSYMPNEPIVYNLINKTKVIVIRQILRSLMKHNLLVISEESNYIFMPELLIDNLEAINNLMVVKDISPQVRYLVLQRQNFTCMTCGETGRPLKIAYLTSDKNINDLSSLIALCDNCYEVTTENEILIDGTITFEADFLNKNKLQSLEFLTLHFQELKNNEYVIKSLEEWEEGYNFNDIIKALTITIDKIKKKKIDGTINALISYTNAILKKTVETGNHVQIYDTLKEQYELDKWIEDILD